MTDVCGGLIIWVRVDLRRTVVGFVQISHCLNTLLFFFFLKELDLFKNVRLSKI